MLNRSDILRYLERDILQKQYLIIASSLIITFATALFPMCIMIFLHNELTEPYFLVKGILHFLIIWLLSNTLAVTIGSSISLLVKNKFAYLFSLIVYGVFIWLSSKLPIKPINRYLNIFDDNTYILSNNISGPLFNINYLLDKLFLILIIMLLIFVVRSFIARKRSIFNFFILGLLIISVCLLPLWGNSKYQTVTAGSITQVTNKPYEIKKYSMKLDLNNKLKNQAELSIYFTKHTKSISLDLEDIFVIKNLKVNNKTVKFTHKNNDIIIPSEYNQGEKIKLSIIYEGNVDVLNNIGVTTYYVSKSAINLPGYIFDWYPNIKSQNQIEFNVSVDTSSKIYSNLSPLFSTTQKQLVGTSSSLNIFAGQYQKVQIDKVQYILPISYNVNAFKMNFENMIMKNTTFSKNDLLRNKKYKQVIVGVWPININSNPIQRVGDTILVNYNE